MTALPTVPGYKIIEPLDLYLAHIDGKKITTLNELYQDVTIALQLPDYFGNNLDALEETLNDLEWIEQTAILLVIQNANFLLFSESPEVREEIMNIFEESENARLEIITIDG